MIKRYFKAQEDHGIVREDLLEKGILLTKDLPRVETGVTMKKGKKPGTVDMVLPTKDKFAIKAGVDYNNYGSIYISKNRYGASFAITEPWWGSTLKLN